MLFPVDPLGYKVSHFRQARRLAMPNSQAAGPLWEFRWGTAFGHMCYVTRVNLMGVQVANSTGGELRFNIKVARNFTVADTTNVASILRAGDMQKLNGAFPDSVLSNFLESNSATAPTGGTYTLDTDPLAIGSYTTLTTASTTYDGAQDDIFDFAPLIEGDQPLRLEKNEGFTVNLEATGQATSGFVMYLEVCWVEGLKLQ